MEQNSNIGGVGFGGATDSGVGGAVGSNLGETKKSGTGLKIGMAVCLVLALAGGGFGTYELLQNKSAKQEISDLKVEIKNQDGSTTSIETDKIKIEDATKTVIISDSSVAGRNESDVKEVITGLYFEFAKHFESGSFYKTFADGAMVPIVGTNVITMTSESYAFKTGSSYYNKDVETQIMNEGDSVAKSFLTTHGFSAVKDLAFNSTLYYNSEKDIHCTTPGSSLPYEVNCTKASWLTEEEKNLALELAEAAQTDIIFAQPSNITDSPVAPYQRLTASTTGAAMLFYRVSPNDKWQFIAGTQMIVPCSKYNEDAKKAWAGTRCWDEATNAEVEL